MNYDIEKMREEIEEIQRQQKKEDILMLIFTVFVVGCCSALFIWMLDNLLPG